MKRLQFEDLMKLNNIELENLFNDVERWSENYKNDISAVLFRRNHEDKKD
jgi:hypothetical protein